MATTAAGPRLFRLNIEVGDIERGADFYARLLGSEGRPQMGKRCYFAAGGVTLQVVEAASVHPAAKALYFAVGDLDSVHARAERLGCLAEGDVHGTPAGKPVVRPWGERSFYCDDPWGNPLCFVDEGTDLFRLTRKGLGPGPSTAMAAPMPAASARSRSRSAARLAAVQALYQHEMERTPLARLLHEFHQHRLGATIEGVEYADAEVDFFDDLVSGVHAREAELDALISARLARGWALSRLDRPMRQILRAGAYELVARTDVPTGSVISEYVDVAKAFYDRKEAAFVNGLLDAVAKDVRG